MRLFKKQKGPGGRLRPSQTEANQRSVFSYYGSTTDTKSPKLSRSLPKTAAAAHHIIHLPVYLALLAILISFLYMMGLTTNPKVILSEPLDGQPQLSRGEEAYHQAARVVMKSSLLNRSKLTIDTTPIEAVLAGHFPELEEVEVDISLFRRRPFVYMSVAPARLTLTTTAGQTFIINKKGRAVMLASEVQRGDVTNLPAVTDQSGLEVVTSQLAMRERDVEYISALVAQLAAKQLSLDSLILPPAASQLDVRAGGQPYTVKFNLELDPRQSVGTFLALKDKLAGEGIVPAEYIDVRVEERAYYK